MGMTFSNYPIRGIDISQFNFEDDLPNLAKAAGLGVKFCGIRTSYGRVTDSKFKANWADARGKMHRLPYHYMDYYSHIKMNLGYSNEEWGIIQARYVWSLIKDDNDKCAVALDIESSNYGGPIEQSWGAATAVAKAFLIEMDRLNGKTNIIYASWGLLAMFGDWFKDRPVWMAWYNEAQPLSNVLARRTQLKWRAPFLIWQYASDGDINNDGIGDGILMGMEYAYLDLNIWLGTQADYDNWIGNATLPPVEVTYPEVIPGVKSRIIPCYRALVNKQFVRNSIWGTKIGELILGEELEILESKKDSDGGSWVRIGNKQWVAEYVGGKKYLEAIAK